MAIALISAVIGSGALFSFITFLITRHDQKKSERTKTEAAIEELNKRMQKAEKDAVRTQLLVLLSDYTDNETEILQVSEYYFNTLAGDWYMTSLFNRFLVERKLGRPEWFKEEVNK